ncbi:hypothetical protein EAG_03590 [Camponotus floridanus]|uniref:Uncharacterized protein n=1 Tax=Camponotus floridanus TaxID=104421 RepID=E2ANY8_CAMFO|nr:hypothetical protein EAG_03590 [Camponotus floridanus]
MFWASNQERCSLNVVRCGVAYERDENNKKMTLFDNIWNDDTGIASTILVAARYLLSVPPLVAACQYRAGCDIRIREWKSMFEKSVNSHYTSLSAICGWLLTGYEGFWKKTKDDDSEVGGEKNLVDDTRFLRTQSDKLQSIDAGLPNNKTLRFMIFQ